MDNSSIAEILIIEDDNKMADLMMVMLDASHEFKCAGIASSYDEAVAIFKKKTPDITVIDIDLSSDKNGIDVIRYITEQKIQTEMLVHTVHEDSETLFEALKAGACGYILKGSSPLEFLTYLAKMKEGEVPISPKIARRILAHFHAEKQSENEALSARELEILKLANHGYTYKQIADKINISKHTVHSHLKQIYTKLQVNSKNEAIRKARKMTLI
jgi:DNA-binding NarL/FixJ family response regulator